MTADKQQSSLVMRLLNRCLVFRGLNPFRQSDNSGEIRKMPQLDGLRCLAVLIVIWSHWSPKYTSLFGIHLGFYGVQMFFVLSGFLITGILFDAAGDDPSRNIGGFVLRQFYIRRFLRIFPLYYAVLVMVVLINVDTFRTTWPWHAAYLSNVHFWMVGSRGDFGGHLWSLSVEEQFYLFWPILMVFSSNKTRLAIICSAIVAAPIYREIFQITPLGKDPSLADGMVFAHWTL
jgi:peptidoglycan/LPS O-acetylase OafA/YrhL